MISDMYTEITAAGSALADGSLLAAAAIVAIALLVAGGLVVCLRLRRHA